MWARPTILGHDYAHDWAVDQPAVRGRIRPRVLVEARDGADAFARVRLLERHGYNAAWCPGPPEAVGSRCPLVGRRDCPLADWADVAVTSLGIEHPAGREILEAMRRAHPDLPVVVETTRDGAADWPDLLHGHRVMTAPATAQSILGALSDVLGDAGPKSPGG